MRSTKRNSPLSRYGVAVLAIGEAAGLAIDRFFLYPGGAFGTGAVPLLVLFRPRVLDDSGLTAAVCPQAATLRGEPGLGTTLEAEVELPQTEKDHER